MNRRFPRKGILAAGIIVVLSTADVLAAPADDLIRGVLSKDTAAVADALSKGAGPDSASRFIAWPAILWAVDVGDARMTAFLIEAGASVHRREPVFLRTPLLHAAVKGDHGIVTLLLGKGASLLDRDVWGWSAVDLARRNGHDGLVRLLEPPRPLVPEADADRKAASRRIFVAVQSRNLGELKALSINRSDLDLCDPEKRVTPLMMASVNDDTAALVILTDAGAAVDFADEFGNTALIHAARFGSARAADHLLRVGANPNAKNAAGATALIIAAKEGHENFVRRLIAAGSDLNARTRERSFEGWTALMMTAGKNRPNVAKILLEAGADATIRSDGGWSAHRIATRNDHPAIVELLRAHGITE